MTETVRDMGNKISNTASSSRSCLVSRSGDLMVDIVDSTECRVQHAYEAAMEATRKEREQIRAEMVILMKHIQKRRKFSSYCVKTGDYESLEDGRMCAFDEPTCFPETLPPVPVDPYWACCICCSARPVVPTPIVNGCIGFNNWTDEAYPDEVNPTSARRYIPLCRGSGDDSISCYRKFREKKLSLVYDPICSGYRFYDSNKAESGAFYGYTCKTTF
jgi:hypothetical protein